MDIGRRTPFVSWPGGGGGGPAWGNVVPPAITGTVLPGLTLTVSDGTWTTLPIAFQYQWRNAGSDIPGATSNTYTLTAHDIADDIDCDVRATDGTYVDSALSNVVNTGPASGLPYCPPNQPAAYWTAIRGAVYGPAPTTSANSTGRPTIPVHPVLLDDGRIFCAPRNTTTAPIYDPGAGTWSSSTAGFNAGWEYIAIKMCDGRVFCMQMRDGAGNAIGQIYDPVADTVVDADSGSAVWRPRTDGDNMYWGLTLLQDGRVFVSPCTRSSNNNALLYDPSTDTVSAIAGYLTSSNQPYRGCTLLPDGRVFTAPCTATDDKGRVYDPSTGTVTATSAVFPVNSGSGSFRRRFGNCILLPDGRVLLVPYDNQFVSYWDPVTDTASLGANIHPVFDSSPRYSSVALGPDGVTVYMARGSVGSRAVVTIYNTATDTFTTTGAFLAESEAGIAMMASGRMFMPGSGAFTVTFGSSIAGIPPARVLNAYDTGR
jgi:hypothetical protein